MRLPGWGSDAGTLDIAWSDATHTHATVTGLVMSLGAVGGAAGLSATITTGLTQATGTTSLTFTQPLV